MKKLFALMLAFCLTLSMITIGQAEEADLLTDVLDSIESFDPETEEVLEVPRLNKSLKYGTNLYDEEMDVFGIERYGITADNIGTTERFTYIPTAGLVLGTMKLLGTTPEKHKLEAYPAWSTKYEQWLVIILDFTENMAYQTWWTPGLSTGEVYTYGDTDAEGFWDYYEREDDDIPLDNSKLMQYCSQVRGDETGYDPLSVGKASFRISDDKQHIYIDRPSISGGSGKYTIAYNIYDADSNPVNYFYSTEAHVAATPGYGGLFNVFIVVRDTETGESETQNIDWQKLNWPYASSLTVGKVKFEISPDKESVFLDRPEVACSSGEVTIAYNIYDSESKPVNYFYSTFPRVAATPGYAGRFNVFIVVTDTVTGEKNEQNIGWVDLGGGQKYRALIVGNSEFRYNNNLSCCKYDVMHMETMLKSVNGGLYAGHITKKENTTTAVLKEAVQTAYSGAKSGDVSLFYVSSHGVVYESGVSADLAGAVLMSDESLVKWKDLASWLSTANPNNKVIVLIGTCGSDSPVTTAGANVVAFDEALYTRSIISAFAAVDKGVTVRGWVKDENGQDKLGELRTSQFEVISACRATETSIGYSTGSLFTNEVIKAVGSDFSLPADTNKDGYITTQELFKYTYDACSDYHHPVVWPSNSSYNMFWK